MNLFYLNDITRTLYKWGNLDHYGYYQVHAGISDFNTNIDAVVYQGCKDDECKKKVWPAGYGFYCEKCDSNYSDFTWRYKLKAFIEDESKVVMVTLFDEMAEALLGVSATEIVDMWNYNLDRYYSIFDQVLNENRMYYFTLRMALVVFEDRTRVNGIVQGFQYDNEYY